MKNLIDTIKDLNGFFKNFFAVFCMCIFFYYMDRHPEAKGEMIVLIAIVIKCYFDTTTSNAKKDETINSLSKSIPDAPSNK